MDDNGNLYAIKRYKKETANLGTLQHELKIMNELKHENLVRLHGVRENATYKRRDESTYSCFAIILEYVGGGELFDFIAETGKFSEKVTRTYFHQMMNGLYHMHSKGYAHRDIKPENILIGRDFVLKLADFGFSCMLKGKDGSGILHTKLGTEGYMAPEVSNKNYDGAKADIFASGVILFIMYAGNPPFEKAAINDPYYKLIKDKNFATFWKAHSRRRPVGFFSDTFRSLFESMVAFNFAERPKIEEIAAHPWVKNVVSSQAEIKQEFDLRLAKLDQIAEAKRVEQEALRKDHMQNANNMGGDRGDLDMESPFLSIYEAEQDITRELGVLEPISADDFTVEENSIYAVSVLKDFCRNKKILLNEDENIEDEDCSALRAVDVKEDNDRIEIKYENSFVIDGQNFTEAMEVAVKLGNSKEGRLTLCLEHVSGSRLYFKKAAKEFKGLYEYCRK